MILKSLLENYRLVLASQSPRRKMLLAGLDLDFEVIVKPDVDEAFPSELGMNEIPVYLARHKSDHYSFLLDTNTLLITADTIVWHRDRLVGKPENLEDAKSIVRELSGETHEVITGVCLRTADKMHTFSSYSKVYFRPLTTEEIDYYVENYKPLDKAGAYGIQEWIGYIGIEKIEGSFYNVMGLPVQTLYSEMIDFLSY